MLLTPDIRRDGTPWAISSSVEMIDLLQFIESASLAVGPGILGTT